MIARKVPSKKKKKRRSKEKRGCNYYKQIAFNIKKIKIKLSLKKKKKSSINKKLKRNIFYWKKKIIMLLIIQYIYIIFVCLLSFIKQKK